jgi:AbrB family looped-hinge helix DNA binding protein
MAPFFHQAGDLRQPDEDGESAETGPCDLVDTSTQFDNRKGLCHSLVMLSSTDPSIKAGMSARVVLKANGRIVIPAAIREQMGFSPGDTLLLEVEDGVLKVESFDARLVRIQDELIQLAGPERMLSDELIAERRAEAWREQVEANREREAMQAQKRKAG